jgi:uncharacterized protein YggE
MQDQKVLTKYLYLVAIVFLVVASLSLAVLAFSYAEKNDSVAYRSFTVSAEGKAVAVPDVAQFSFTVFNEGDSDVSALEQSTVTTVKTITDYLDTVDVSKEDIRTDSYLVEPRYKYFQCKADGTCPPAEIEGYKVSQTTTVKVRDFEKVGEILTKVASLKANNVSQLSFVVDDKSKVENEARSNAIALAKEKAKSTAKAGGFKLGKLISVNESFMPYAGANYAYGDYSMAKEAMATESVESMVSAEINPGTEDVVVSVNLTYGIK